MQGIQGELFGEPLEDAKGWLGQVTVGEPLHHRSLTVFPLFAAGWAGEEAAGLGFGAGKSDRYVLLSDAIDSSEAVVEEVSEHGSVPLLAVSNSAVQPILIPEGEILIGGKQNRVVNLTVLVAAAERYQVPVSCVEQGRWGYASRTAKAESFAHPRLRERKIKSAQLRRAAGGEAYSDQMAVWASVEERLYSLEASSPTRNMVDGYRAAEGRMRHYREAIRLPANATGLLALTGSRVIGLDLFDAPETLHKLWPRLGDAYFVEAVSDDGEVAPAKRLNALMFLALVAQSLVPAQTQPEVGVELEVASDEISGAALWHDGALCHLAAFAVEN